MKHLKKRNLKKVIVLTSQEAKNNFVYTLSGYIPNVILPHPDELVNKVFFFFYELTNSPHTNPSNIFISETVPLV